MISLSILAFLGWSWFLYMTVVNGDSKALSLGILNNFFDPIGNQRFVVLLTFCAMIRRMVLSVVSGLNLNHGRASCLILLKGRTDFLLNFNLLYNLNNLLLNIFEMNLFFLVFGLLNLLELFNGSELFNCIIELLIDLRRQLLGVREQLFKLSHFSIGDG